MSCSIHSAAITAEPVSVSVNGVPVPRDAIAREVQQHPASTPLAAWKEAARALVVRELLLQEARRLNLSGDLRSDSRGRRETEEDAAIRVLIESEVKVPQHDDATCRRYYDQNRSRFCSTDIYEAAHILIAANARDAETYREARDRADVLLREIVQNPTRFGDLARLHSDCPSGAQGGNLGQISTGQTTPAFERALRSLEPGHLVSDPVATHYGFHVIRLDRKIKGKQLPFEAVAARIADYLDVSVTHRATAQYVARLVAKASITGIDLAAADAHRVY